MAGRGAGGTEHFVRMIVVLVDSPIGAEMLGDAPADGTGRVEDDKIGDAFGLGEYSLSPVASKAAISASVRCMLEFWPR
ncbi:hypothetical protein AJ87_32030 [Rhizobium yanglingense]|nr:hypothetical protein AJ87_32030 [Rhizobium yanglingense]